MAHARKWIALPLLCLALIAAACGGGGDGNGATTTITGQGGTSSPTAVENGTETADLSGTWTGTWTSTSLPGSEGTFEIVWQQSGSNLAGTISVTNSECVADGSITGSVSGNTIDFGAVQGAFEVTYDGSFSGDTMSGTYSSPSCGDATGTWEATRA